jgi:hypothetical protein
LQAWRGKVAATAAAFAFALIVAVPGAQAATRAPGGLRPAAPLVGARPALTQRVTPAPLPAPATGEEQLSDERTHTLWAFVRRPAQVRPAPDGNAAPVGRLRTQTYFGLNELVLVLGRSTSDGGAWSRIRYPGLGDRTGWVPSATLDEPEAVDTRLVIDRRRTVVQLYRDDRLVFRARVGVGAHKSPTPAGSYYVRERLVPKPGGIYGVLAFGLSAYSRFRTDWPGGGQVGLHGTNEPKLIPGHISNGCIRLRDARIKALDRLMPLGTPIEIR